MTEKLSALFDGDTDEAALSPALESLRRDPRLREKWNVYCLIGDAIRGDPVGEPDLSARVMARLEFEPTVLSPTLGAHPELRSRSSWGRVLLPVAASVMGVAVVGWAMQVFKSEGPDVGPAMAPMALVVPPPRGLEPKDDPYQQYVFAHQILAGRSAIPGVAQYVRTVAESRSGSE